MSDGRIDPAARRNKSENVWASDFGLADITEDEDNFALDAFQYDVAEDKNGNISDKEGRRMIEITPVMSQRSDHRDEGGRRETPDETRYIQDWPGPGLKIQKLQTGPFRPYPYQAAQTRLTPEEQREIEPIVFDTFDSEYVIPDRTINAEIPDTQQASLHEQPEPVPQMVHTIKTSGAKAMNDLGRMEMAMADYYGINFSSFKGTSGMGGIFKKLKKSVSKVVKKNKVLQVAHGLALTPLNPVKGTQVIARAIGGKAGKTIATIAAPHQAVKKLINDKKKAKANEKSKKAIAQAAKEKAEAAAAAKAAAERTKAESEVKKNCTISYKEAEQYRVDPNTKQTIKGIVKVPDLVHVFIPEYGNITIPYELYKATPPLELYQAAVEYKIAQDAQMKLEEEAQALENSMSSMNDELFIRTEEMQTLQQPGYMPATPMARTSEEIIKDNAAAALAYMQQNNVITTPQTIDYYAGQYSSAWNNNQTGQIDTLKTTVNSMNYDLNQTREAQQQIAGYIQQYGGIPQPPPAYPAQTPPEEYEFEEAWSDYKVEAESSGYDGGGYDPYGSSYEDEGNWWEV